MKKFYMFMFIFLGLMSLSLISAVTVQVYYSPTCPHCLKYIPVAKQIFPDVQFINVNEGSYGIQTVPYTIMKFDYGVVEFSGNNPNKLNCEIQQMSTRDCLTYSADESHIDWFK